MEQQLAGRRGCVHPLRQRAELDLLVLEGVDDGEQVGERAPKSIKLPDDQYVAGTDELERFDQARSVVLRAGRVVLEQLSSIDASGQQGIALQVRALPIGVRRHAHVANQHRRITIKKRFPYAPTKR